MPTRGTLLVTLAEPVSAWVAKGEVIDRYLNPSDYFDEVHVLLTNSDRPPLDALQKMAGSARVAVTNLPAGPGVFAKSLGWRPRLLRDWAEPAVGLARQIGPACVRSYGAHLNAYAGMRAARAVGTPHIVSVHTNPDVDRPSARPGLKLRVADAAIRRASALTLRDADLVLPVYASIVPYLRRLGVTRIEVAYNVINPTALRVKTDYRRHGALRVISVGRQFSEKNPVNLVLAALSIEDVELTLVGTGEAHGQLRAAAAGCERVHFIESMANDALCEALPSFDAFGTHSLYRGIPKTVLEAALTGLPIILNHVPGPPVPELGDGLCHFVEDSVRGYADALTLLATDDAAREELGRHAFRLARAKWSPEATEQRFAELYQRVCSPESTADRAEGREYPSGR